MAPPERRAPRPFDHDSGREGGGERLLADFTDPEIRRQIAENPDAAPELDKQWFERAQIVRRDSGNPDIEDIKANSVDFTGGERGRYALTRQDPFQVMDSWDDEVIINELKGHGPKGKLVYSFRQQGKTIVGLGKEGVDFCCQLLLSQGQVIRELDLQYTIVGEKEEREAHFTSKAGRFAVGSRGEIALDTVIATKRQPLYITNRETGEVSLNPHWFEQGSQKALRNARIRLLPIALREYVISLSSSTGRVQSNQQQKPEDPTRQPATDAQRKLYAQMLSSHHFKPEEREKAISWLSEKRHSVATLSKSIEALEGLILTRTEEEKRAQKSAEPGV